MSESVRYIPASVDCPAELTPAAVASLANDLGAAAAGHWSFEDAASAGRALAATAARWLDRADPIRRQATGEPFGDAMWAVAVEHMFAPITPAAVSKLIEAEFPRPGRSAGRVGVILAGNVPAAAVQTIFCGLLSGSSVVVKTAADDRVFPVLLARSIEAISPSLARRLAVVHWSGDSHDHNRALAEHVNAVIAFGRADTLASWQAIVAQAPNKPALIEHGPRTSVELIDLPDGEPTCRRLAQAVADDVALYDQQGCLSPQQIYLAGGQAERFVDLLAEAFVERARRWPVPKRELGVRLAIRRARESVMVRRAVGGPAAPWLLAGLADRFDWTIIGASGTALQIGPGGRTVFVSRVGSLDQAVAAIAPAASALQGVALHATKRRDDLARRLVEELTIPYVCPPGELQRPPFGWCNDGISALGALTN